MRSVPASRSVVSVLLRELGDVSLHSSRPALRAAACGGRPRPAAPPEGSLPTDRHPLRSASAVAAYRPSRSSLLAALVTGLLASAFLWPRTRVRTGTAYAPGPPWTEIHWGPPGPWRNVVGLTTSYPLALLVGVVVAGLVLSIGLLPRVAIANVESAARLRQLANEASGRRGRASPSGSACDRCRQGQPRSSLPAVPSGARSTASGDPSRSTAVHRTPT
jgi:hypothetical protein